MGGRLSPDCPLLKLGMLHLLFRTIQFFPANPCKLSALAAAFSHRESTS